ncbi:hypothetical protein LCGC14_2975960 [marine sediment metagenome]|uniref:Uncharacterized protein n=1 Tax=marine sediment metagenome TaxID=412755 RepID=A0A0F8ZZB0_9ZZZZ
MAELSLVLNTISDVCLFMDKADYDITELVVALQSVDIKTGWVIQLGKCRICGYEELDICPLGCDTNNLECNNCNNMTMQGKELEEWWQ